VTDLDSPTPLTAFYKDVAIFKNIIRCDYQEKVISTVCERYH